MLKKYRKVLELHFKCRYGNTVAHTAVQALTRTAGLGHLEDKHWAECHKLFKTTNGLFDVMNVKVPKEDSRTRRHGNGLALEEQDKILDDMFALMMCVRAIERRSLLPFRKGDLQSNNALKGPYADLNKRYALKYVLTYRLNQDVLENFFETIRAKGGLHDHSDQFKYRLRSYLLGRNNEVLSAAANVEVDNIPGLESSGKSLTGIILTNIKFNDETAPSDEQEIGELTYYGLENFAGYICHKLKNAVPDIAEPKNTDASCFTWVDHFSEARLSKTNAGNDDIYERIRISY